MERSPTWLEEIHVRGLALLEEIQVTLAPGLNVISGETGEGKSLILQAVLLLLGARGRRGLVRSGAREAVVEGRFRIDGAALASLSDLIDPDAEELCLRRVVTAEGQSRAYLDGSLCPVGLLTRLGARLVDIHGQRHALLRPADQLMVVDRFAGAEELAARYRDLHHELRDVEAKLKRADAVEGERLARLEFLRFQVTELDAAAAAEGEEGELETRLRILAGGTDLEGILREGAEALSQGDGAVSELCARLARRLEEVGVATGGAFETIAQRLRSLGIEADDLGQTMLQGLGLVESDPGELERTEARLGLLRHLARRLRVSVDGLVPLRAALRGQIHELEDGSDGASALESRRGAVAAQMEDVGKTLWTKRRDAAARLERALRPALAELRMERASVRCRVDPPEWPEVFDASATVADGPGAVGFWVAANPGEPEQPLEAVASGGETARILLALKGALAGAHDIPLLIFDEIDAGIGGRVGMPFGRRIAQIARHHQVLLVTHLPQVAAYADRHLLVRKEVLAGRTRTRVEVLEGEPRELELAAMLGGVDRSGSATPAARTQARALLEEAAS